MLDSTSVSHNVNQPHSNIREFGQQLSSSSSSQTYQNSESVEGNNNNKNNNSMIAKNNHRRTISPKDVLSYNPVESMMNKLTIKSQSSRDSNETSESTSSSSTSISSFNPSSSSSSSSPTSSESDLSLVAVKAATAATTTNALVSVIPQIYNPPSNSTIAQCVHQSTKSNKNLQELADILRNRRQMLGHNHPKVGHSLNNIGHAHFRRGEFGLALDAYSEALEIFKLIHGRYHVLVGATLGNLGTVYWRIRKLKKSMAMLEESLLIHRSNFVGVAAKEGDDNMEVAATLHNLGLVCCLAQDYQKAESYLTRALDARRNMLGNTHVDVARTLDALGHVYANMEEPLLALKYHHNALRTKKAMLGSNHPSVVVSYMNIANVYKQIQDYDEAIIFYKDAYEAQVASTSSDDAVIKRETGTTLHLLGMVQMENKKVYDALKSFTQATVLYTEAGLTEEKDECFRKLKESSYTAKRRIRGKRSQSCY